MYLHEIAMFSLLAKLSENRFIHMVMAQSYHCKNPSQFTDIVFKANVSLSNSPQLFIQLFYATRDYKIFSNSSVVLLPN